MVGSFHSSPSRLSETGGSRREQGVRHIQVQINSNPNSPKAKQSKDAEVEILADTP